VRGSPLQAGQVNGCPFGSFWASKMNIKYSYDNVNSNIFTLTCLHNKAGGLSLRFNIGALNTLDYDNLQLAGSSKTAAA
jgi:hypothetical protein